MLAKHRLSMRQHRALDAWQLSLDAHVASMGSRCDCISMDAQVAMLSQRILSGCIPPDKRAAVLLSCLASPQVASASVAGKASKKKLFFFFSTMLGAVEKHRTASIPALLSCARESIEEKKKSFFFFSGILHLALHS